MGKAEQVAELEKQLRSANTKGGFGAALIIVGVFFVLFFPIFGIVCIFIGAILAIIGGSTRRKTRYELAKLK